MEYIKISLRRTILIGISVIVIGVGFLYFNIHLGSYVDLNSSYALSATPSSNTRGTFGEIRGCTADTYKYREPTRIPGFKIIIEGEAVPLDSNGSCYKKQLLFPGLHHVTSVVPPGYSSAYYWSCPNCPGEAPPFGYLYGQAPISNGQASIDIEVPKGGNIVLWWRFFPETPIGWLDSVVVDENPFVTGWTLDPGKEGATEDKQIEVKFYIDGLEGVGIYAGKTIANIPYSDVEMPFSGNHGFYWYIPKKFKDGKTHQLFALGVDLETGKEYLLTQTPRTFIISP